MGKIGRTVELAKASLEVLRADKELLLLPVLSFVASAFVGATFLIPTLLVVDQESLLTYVIAFITYVALAYVTIFFNTALVAAADERLQGGDPTLGSALRGASKRAGRIFPWAVVSATVSILLRTLEQRGGIFGRIAASLAGLAWGLVTFLVIPVLVIEDVPVRDAIRRSGELFKRTWGENVVAMVGFGLLGFVAILPAVALVGLAVTSGNATVAAISVAVAVVWIVGVAVVLSALNAIFQTALYRYAADGKPVGPFTPEIMGSAFAPKR